jgi:hypothetical protein
MATTGRKSLRMLVCSGNLGNDEPDVKSLERWIPEDGTSSCQQVLQDQKYPLMQYEGEENGKVLDDDSPGEQCSHFDLIVLGLQESTFIPRGVTQEEEEEEEEEEDAEVEPTLSEKPAAPKEDKSCSTYSCILDPTLSIPGKIATAVSHLSAQTTVTAAKARDILVTNSTKVLHQLLQDRLPSYTRHVSFPRGEMRLLLYARTVLAPTTRSTSKVFEHKIRARQDCPTREVLYCIVAQVQVNETTTLSFVSCHLEAHEGLKRYKTRCSTLGDILRGTKATPYPDVSLASHYCFVLQ